MKYLPVVSVAFLVSACGSLTDTTNLINYSNSKSVKVLEVPADLDKPVFDETYVTSLPEKYSKTAVSSVDTSVPLVDSSLTKAPAASSIKIEKKGAQSVLTVAGGNNFWESSLSALTEMGMTVKDSNKATGIVNVRDRALIAEPGSAIGDLLNRTMGRVNEGEEYQVTVKGGSVVFANKNGGTLDESEATQLLGRFKKELIDLQ